MNRPRMKTREERFVTVTDLELRADGDKPLRILGHPLRYNVWSEDLGGFRERIAPGAATKTIAESDIRALFNHDPNFVLGRNKAETLTLRDEAKGVHMELFPPETPTVRDHVVTPMERGDINQMSFAFRVVNPEPIEPEEGQRYGDHWELKNGMWERTLNEIRLFDVSIVTFPAYTQTDAAVRDAIGMLSGGGIDFPALTALLTRAERGLPISDTDIDLLRGSIDVLRSYIPVEPDDGEGADPAEADAPLTEPQAGRSVVHLRRLLELRERELAQAS